MPKKQFDDIQSHRRKIANHQQKLEDELKKLLEKSTRRTSNYNPTPIQNFDTPQIPAPQDYQTTWNPPQRSTSFQSSSATKTLFVCALLLTAGRASAANKDSQDDDLTTDLYNPNEYLEIAPQESDIFISSPEIYTAHQKPQENALETEQESSWFDKIYNALPTIGLPGAEASKPANPKKSGKKAISFDSFFAQNRHKISIKTNQHLTTEKTDKIIADFKESCKKAIREGNSETVVHCLKNIDHIYLMDMKEAPYLPIEPGFEHFKNMAASYHNIKTNSLHLLGDFEAKKEKFHPAALHEMTHFSQVTTRIFKNEKNMQKCFEELNKIAKESYDCIFTINKVSCEPIKNLAKEYKEREVKLAQYLQSDNDMYDDLSFEESIIANQADYKPRKRDYESRVVVHYKKDGEYMTLKPIGRLMPDGKYITGVSQEIEDLYKMQVEISSSYYTYKTHHKDKFDKISASTNINKANARQLSSYYFSFATDILAEGEAYLMTAAPLAVLERKCNFQGQELNLTMIKRYHDFYGKSTLLTKSAAKHLEENGVVIDPKKYKIIDNPKNNPKVFLKKEGASTQKLETESQSHTEL